MRKKRKIVLSFVIMLVFCMVRPINTEAAQKLSSMSAKQIAVTLQKAGFPIEYEVYTTNREDPNRMIGKPHAYKSKVDFWDSKYYDEYVDYSGTVEVFRNSSDATKRKQYLKNVYKMHPSWEMRMYQYSNVLVRIDYSIPGSRSEAYKNAFVAMSKGKTVGYPLTISKKSMTLRDDDEAFLSLNIDEKKAKWKSSNYNVVTVSNFGKVVAKKPGTATISATYKNTTVQCRVTVKKSPMHISCYSNLMCIGEMFRLKVVNGSGKIVWKSSNPSVAVVNSKGYVKAKKFGETVITAAVGKKRFVCEISVIYQKVNISDINISVVNWNPKKDTITFRIKNNTSVPVTIEDCGVMEDANCLGIESIELKGKKDVVILPGKENKATFVTSFPDTLTRMRRTCLSILIGNKEYTCSAIYTGKGKSPFMFEILE